MLNVRHTRMHACDVDLHVARAGNPDGPAVFLLHGFPENWTSWRHQIGPLADAGFDVFVPDMRGYNESDRPTDRDSYRLRLLIDDVAELVRSCGHRRAHVIGHDWGGAVAWTFAGAYPELIDRLVIMNAPHLQLYHKALRKPSQMLRSWYVAMFLIPGLAEKAFSRNNWQLMRDLFARKPVRPNAFTSEDIEQYIAAASQPGALTAMLNYYRALASDPGSKAIGRKARIECETLVIWGYLDPALTRHNLTDIEDIAPLVTVHRIPDAGHWVQNEAPEEVNRMMMQFLLSHPESPPA